MKNIKLALILNLIFICCSLFYINTNSHFIIKYKRLDFTKIEKSSLSIKYKNLLKVMDDSIISNTNHSNAKNNALSFILIIILICNSIIFYWSCLKPKDSLKTGLLGTGPNLSEHESKI